MITQKPIFYLACDHSGLKKKQFIHTLLLKEGCIVHDLGTDTEDAVDYPDYAYMLAKKLQEDPSARGILLCGTGIGIAIAANRFFHIRAALCTDSHSVSLARAHNDANVLVLAARRLKRCQIRKFIQLFLNTPFEAGRHLRRVYKLNCPVLP